MTSKMLLFCKCFILILFTVLPHIYDYVTVVQSIKEMLTSFFMIISILSLSANFIQTIYLCFGTHEVIEENFMKEGEDYYFDC